MDIAPGIVDNMYTVSSTNSMYIPRQTVERYLEGYAPGISEWLIADCGGINNQDHDWYMDIMVKNDLTTIPPHIWNIIREIQKREAIVNECYERKIAQERLRLARESPL